MAKSSTAAGLSPIAAAGVAAGVLALSGVLGRRNAPDPTHPRIERWYKRLAKPPFTPPDPVFGAVWPVLETGAAVGGYRLMRAEPSPRRNAAVALWLANTAMIGGWTELFFRRRLLASSATAAAAMTAGTAALVAVAWRVDRPAAASVAPLAAWLAFATLLSEEIWRRNDQAGDGTPRPA